MATSLVNGKYRITKRIGGGSFGEIYMGIGLNGEKVAVKFERHGTRCPQLRHEYKVYRELANCHGFCSVYHFGTQDNYNVMVMDLLGPSLEDLFNKCQRRFSLKTVLQLADQMLERVDTLHSRHLIHRDIKPANFVIGIGDQGANVYCVDFGLSKRYRHPKSLQHIPHRDGRSLTGTPRYASINNHLGIEQSRRDDLESIGYVLVYFLKGTLPWQGLKAKNAQKKYRMILEKKQQVSIAQLCQGCPSQFAEFLAYTRSLKFDAKPDIPYIRKLFRDLYHAQGCAAVGKLWDWDHIDTDFMTSGGGSGSIVGPPIISNPRPSTGAAVGGGGGGGGDMMGDGDMGTTEDMADDDYGMRPSSAKERPASSGALPSAGAKQQATQQQHLLSSSWGFSRQGADPTARPASGAMIAPSGREEYGIGAGIADSAQKRPHTAHGGRVGTAAPSGLGANDGRKGSLEPDEEGDAHVVAGARAMMRYRRTRPADGTDGVGGPPQQSTGRGTWTGDAGGGAPRGVVPQPGVYQGVSSAGQMTTRSNTASQQAAMQAGIGGYGQLPSSLQQPQQQQLQQQQQQQQQQQLKQQQQQYLLQRDKASAGSSAGWLGGPTADRPKSAGTTGLMTTLTGGGTNVTRNTVGATSGPGVSASSGAPVTAAGAGGAAGAPNNTLSYGSLKNRFLSGSKTKSSKLFSLSR